MSVIRRLSKLRGVSGDDSRSAGLPSQRRRDDRPLRVIPDPTNRLADGILVEAQIRARLLGAPILRLDAIVLLSPARAAAATDDVWSDSTKLMDPRAAPALPPSRPGTTLADAISLVEQSADSLRLSSPNRRSTRR
jgi:hypothetical protein